MRQIHPPTLIRDMHSPSREVRRAATAGDDSPWFTRQSAGPAKNGEAEALARRTARFREGGLPKDRIVPAEINGLLWDRANPLVLLILGVLQAHGPSVEAKLAD